MADSTSIALYTLATDLLNTLTEEIDKLTNYRDINISDTSNIVLSCLNLPNEDDTSSITSAYDTFLETFDTYIPMIEVNPSEDNEFFNSLKDLYSIIDLSGISTPSINNFDADNTSNPITEFGQNFLFYSSSNLITGAISASLVDFSDDDFIIAAYLSGLAHNTAVSKLQPIILNAINISALLDTSTFSDIIDPEIVSSLVSNMNTILNDLFITTDGSLDIDTLLTNILNEAKAENIRNIMNIYDMFFNTIYGQIITMGYALSESNYKINLTTLQSLNPLP